jgi:DNA-binding SARP family transcriptional activator/DNA-binding beta-propeller fold protein YncE
VLGALEVTVAGRPVELGGAKQRALLAVLVLHANHPVPVGRLIGELWERPPATAPKSVQVYVSRLRRMLGGTSARILTTPAGYLLSANVEDIDVQRFEALAAEGRSVLPNDPAAASVHFHQALALWRGAPLADLASEPFARLAIPALKERQLAVLEERIEADLASGRSGGLVGDLDDLLSRNPYRERLYALLMVALYRAGRQAEALAVYQRARATLDDELGIEPGPELRRLHAAILRQDPGLQRAGPSKPWPLTSDSDDGVQRGDLAGTPAAQSPPAPPPDQEASSLRVRHPRRRTRVIVGICLALAAAVVITLALLPPGSRPTRVAVGANSVAVIDAATGTVVGDISVGHRPGPIATASGAVWVANSGDLTLERIGLRARTATKTFGLSQPAVSLTAGPGVVWIGNAFDGTLSRVLTTYNQLSAPFFPGRRVAGLLAVATSPGDLWIGLADDELLRLDPDSLRVKATIKVPGRVEKIAVVGRALWTLQFFDNSVKRIDPRTGRITATALPGRPVAIAAGSGAVWVATSGEDELWKLNLATGAISGSFPLGVTPSAIAVQPGAVWVAAESDGLLERIDPASGTIVPLNLHHAIGGLAIAGGNVWLTLD